jgi:DNA-binding Lrp family transcriptional regulator
MKARAYVLVETAVGKTKTVVTALKKMDGVNSVDTVTGPYDVIAIVEADTLNEVGDIITARIHTVDGISRTVTCLVV